MSPVVPANEENSPLPLRDWLLLPLLGLLTIFLIAVSVESISRHYFEESKTSLLNCLVMNDPSTGVRGIPNSVCPEKIFEAEPMEYRFNSCGYRAGPECGPKPPGTYRIVVVGSSTTAGLRLPWEQTFPSMLPRDLARMTARKVDVYNQGVEWGSPRNVDLRTKDALASRPDMILWMVTPWDVEFSAMLASSVPTVAAPAPAAVPPPRRGVLARLGRKAMSDRVRNFRTRMMTSFAGTRTAFMLQHVLYMSQSQYVNHFLQSKGATFLRTDPSADWQARVKQFDIYEADVQAQAAAAGVRLVVTFLPHRAQASMISMGVWPAGFDPWKLGDSVRSIVESHGGTYFDILRDFRRMPNPERYFFPVDGHSTAEGHVVINGLLLKGLTGGAVPELSVASRPQPASWPGR